MLTEFIWNVPPIITPIPPYLNISLLRIQANMQKCFENYMPGDDILNFLVFNRMEMIGYEEGEKWYNYLYNLLRQYIVHILEGWSICVTIKLKLPPSPSHAIVKFQLLSSKKFYSSGSRSLSQGHWVKAIGSRPLGQGHWAKVIWSRSMGQGHWVKVIGPRSLGQGHWD